MTTLTSTRPVAIRRWVLGRPKGWVVTCTDCMGGDFLGSLLRPVVSAHLWVDALWWANWHAREHDLTECGRCSHRPAVEPVTVLDGDTVKVGERLFRRVPGGWQEAPA